MVDLGGYVIILVETKDKRVKLYGSPADKAELEVADEILEINGKSLNNSSHSQVITHIHNCIKSRTICLRVKRRTGSKLAEELAESSNVQDAFVIAVEQQARERLEKLSALRKIKPVDMTVLSQELCDDKRGERETPVYSTPLSRIGSNHNVRAVVENETGRERNLSGAEELELNQRLNRSRDPSAEMDSSRDINSRTSDRSRDLSRTSSRSKDLSRTSSRSRDHSKDIARSRDSSRDSLVSGESGISRESLRSRDNKPGLGLRSRNPSKETVISKDSCIDRLSSRSQTLDRSRNGSRKCQGIGAGSTGSICSNYQDTTRITPGSHQTLDSSVSRRNSERLGERIKNSVDIRSSQDPLLTEGTRRNSRYNETNQPLGDIHSSLARSVDTKLGCEPNPILLNSSPIKTIETKSSLQNKLTPPEEFNSIEPGAERSLEPDLTEQKSESFPLKFINDSEASSCHNLKEVLIGGDTEGNRSARGSVRQRHEVKTFSEIKEEKLEELVVRDKPALRATHSLKTVLEVEEMSKCVGRISSNLAPFSALLSSPGRKDKLEPDIQHTDANPDPGQQNSHNNDVMTTEELSSIQNDEEKTTEVKTSLQSSEKTTVGLNSLLVLFKDPMFSRLMRVHNTIQLVQCFRCPPPPLCTDARDLVQECMVSLQGSPLPESVEILDILNKIEFEGLFYSHDKLADLQGGMPWKRCLAEMWTRDRTGNSTPDSNTRVVRITKHNEPLGATVRNEGEKVVIGRVVKGGAAERSGNLNPGDEVLEVNGLRLTGKSVHDICSTLCQMSGTLTFVIIPGPQSAQEEETQPVFHYRAHFSYTPEDDLYIPCHELGISFQRGDILHVINKDDPHWWQAYRDGEWTQTLAGLIPSLALQQHRLALQRQKKDQESREQSTSPSRKKTTSSSLLCTRKPQKRRSASSPFRRDAQETPPYEEMALYYPQPNQKRPLILVGPPSIGRHELRQRLLDDTSKFAAPVPHTTRGREEGEIDGVDYYFVSKQQFETMVTEKRFLEHGEYDKQMYGTSTSSIKSVLTSAKICVLNIQPSSLPAFHDSDLKPYVVFLTPPSPHISRHLKLKNGDMFKEDEYRELVIIAHNMEENYGHFFDSVIPFEDVDFVLKQVMYEISLLEREPQWVPAKWVQ